MNALHLTTVLAAALASTARASSDGGGQWTNYPNMDPALEAACRVGQMDDWRDDQGVEHPGVTPLLAAYENPPDNLKAYVDAKRQHGFSPLHLAAINRSLEVTNALLAAGADPNAQTDVGESPLHFINNVDVAQALVAAGADHAIKNCNGDTTLVIAQRYAEDSPIVQYLQTVTAADTAAIEEKQAFGARVRDDSALTLAATTKSLDAQKPALKRTAENALLSLRGDAERQLALWEGSQYAPDASSAARQKMVAYYTTAVAKLQAKLDQLNGTPAKQGAGSIVLVV